MAKNRIRCAIYTRKSTEDGLEQEFNSLSAQREACAAYIASQKGEGWKEVEAQFGEAPPDAFSGDTAWKKTLTNVGRQIREGLVSAEGDQTGAT